MAKDVVFDCNPVAFSTDAAIDKTVDVFSKILKIPITTKTIVGEEIKNSKEYIDWKDSKSCKK